MGVGVIVSGVQFRVFIMFRVPSFGSAISGLALRGTMLMFLSPRPFHNIVAMGFRVFGLGLIRPRCASGSFGSHGPGICIRVQPWFENWRVALPSQQWSRGFLPIYLSTRANHFTLIPCQALQARLRLPMQQLRLRLLYKSNHRGRSERRRGLRDGDAPNVRSPKLEALSLSSDASQ